MSWPSAKGVNYYLAPSDGIRGLFLLFIISSEVKTFLEYTKV